MGNFEFFSDLVSGEQAEDRVVKYLQPRYPRAHRVPLAFKEWDVTVPERRANIEVKCDEMAYKTGNYFIEAGYKEKPSGIEVTKADWWSIVDEDKIWFIETQKLILLAKHYKIIKSPPKGNDGTRAGYLIPREKLWEMASRI